MWPVRTRSLVRRCSDSCHCSASGLAALPQLQTLHATLQDLTRWCTGSLKYTPTTDLRLLAPCFRLSHRKLRPAELMPTKAPETKKRDRAQNAIEDCRIGLRVSATGNTCTRCLFCPVHARFASANHHLIQVTRPFGCGGSHWYSSSPLLLPHRCSCQRAVCCTVL